MKTGRRRRKDGRTERTQSRAETLRGLVESSGRRRDWAESGPLESPSPEKQKDLWLVQKKVQDRDVASWASVTSRRRGPRGDRADPVLGRVRGFSFFLSVWKGEPPLGFSLPCRRVTRRRVPEPPLRCISIQTWPRVTAANSVCSGALC